MNSGESRYYKYSLLNPEDEKKLIAKYRRLSPASRKRLSEYVRLLELSDAQEN